MTAVMSVGAGHERILDRYRRQTVVSDPGLHLEALAALPRDVGELIELIGGVFAHYEFDLDGFVPSDLSSVDLRTVSAILDRVFSLDSGPLDVARKVERRYLGVCRDASLLLCSIMRAQGVPARLRYGMARHYYDPRRPMHDHVVVEYWCPSVGWRYADGRMYRQARSTAGLGERYRDDVPAGLFMTGGEIWRLVRGSEDAARRISGPLFSADAGQWMARNLFLYDLASLYGWEPLMWDAWGFILRTRKHVRPRGARQLRTLDRFARYDARDPDDWARLMQEYRRTWSVRLPARVLSVSEINGRHQVPAPAAWRVRDAVH